MISAGDIVSYLEMCQQEGASLQRGMNFRLKAGRSVILMSVRKGAPYADEVLENGRVLIYEGHDVPQRSGAPDPKTLDQPLWTPGSKPTQNYLFYQAAQRSKTRKTEPELVKVYEKIYPGIWVYNGLFELTDARQEEVGHRKVFKFRLELIEAPPAKPSVHSEIEHNRMIPTAVKLEVWKRDKGKCVKCGKRDNLHFDHLIPFSKGGSSLLAKNIQLLCARHNLEKRDRIE